MSAILGSLLNTLTNSVKVISLPFPVIPPLLLLCDIQNRPGLSAIDIGTQIVARLPEIGIPNTPNKDGSDNLIIKFAFLLAEVITKAVKTNGIAMTVIPPHSLKITGTGVTAAGDTFVFSGTNPKAEQFRGALQ